MKTYEPTDKELALWDAIKAMDDRVRAVDYVPRASLDFEGLDDDNWKCLCVKLWSEPRQEHAYIESWYTPCLLNDISAAMAYFGGPMGIMPEFEWAEAHL